MEDLDSIPGLGRSPGEGKGYPVQYFGLENSRDCVVHGVKELDTTERPSLPLAHGLQQGCFLSLDIRQQSLRLDFFFFPYFLTILWPFLLKQVL